MSQQLIDIPEVELMGKGHVACPGCGSTVAMRFVLKALGEETMAVIPACCWTIIDGPTPSSVLKIPVMHTAFETAASAASGLKHGLVARGEENTTVMAWAGDGGTFDIGFQAISGAAERNEDIIYFTYDNEAYMNTGVQRSSATPEGASTTTTPTKTPKNKPKKDIVEALAAHHIPYIATASIAFPEDLIAKVEKAKEIRGMKFIHIISPCPPGWKSLPNDSIHLARLAVETKIFPLYEVEEGWKYHITHESKGTPVKEYLKAQGRFNHLTDADIEHIQKTMDRKWKMLKMKEKLSLEEMEVLD